MPLARVIPFPAARTFQPQPSRRTKLFAVVSQLAPADIELLASVAAKLIEANLRRGLQ